MYQEQNNSQYQQEKIDLVQVATQPALNYLISIGFIDAGTYEPRPIFASYFHEFETNVINIIENNQDFANIDLEQIILNYANYYVVMMLVDKLPNESRDMLINAGLISLRPHEDGYSWAVVESDVACELLIKVMRVLELHTDEKIINENIKVFISDIYKRETVQLDLKDYYSYLQDEKYLQLPRFDRKEYEQNISGYFPADYLPTWAINVLANYGYAEYDDTGEVFMVDNNQKLIKDLYKYFANLLPAAEAMENGNYVEITSSYEIMEIVGSGEYLDFFEQMGKYDDILDDIKHIVVNYNDGSLGLRSRFVAQDDQQVELRANVIESAAKKIKAMIKPDDIESIISAVSKLKAAGYSIEEAIEILRRAEVGEDVIINLPQYYNNLAA